MKQLRNASLDKPVTQLLIFSNSVEGPKRVSSARVNSVQDPRRLLLESDVGDKGLSEVDEALDGEKNLKKGDLCEPLLNNAESLADKAILSSVDNRPPMLKKDMYDSWKSRMELYMLNRQHGKMILESVEQGPLLWPSVEVERVTRLKKYSELSAAEAIQADCDVKATNIILQGLPPEVYALVSTHKVAKELWERI
nr:hypothetical protein [Tanacetum cinerariifolium]